MLRRGPLFILLGAAAAEEARSGRDPTPPAGLGPSSADCATCHAATHAEWAGSRHAVAASNAIFQASWSERPDGWCLGCHAPLVAQQAELVGGAAIPGVARRQAAPAGDLWEEGVNCLACHGGDGAIRSATTSAEAEEAHPVQVEPDFGSPTFCATCHQFNFQRHTAALPFSYGPTPMQDTVAEWRGSGAAARGEDCAACHFPDGDHRAPGAHDGALLRSALRVDVTRDDGGVVATVSADAPHRVPTGDPFRRLELLLCADSACASPLETFTLRRRFDRTATTWRLREDTTLPPSTTAASARSWRTSVDAAWWVLRVRYGDRALEADLAPADVGEDLLSGPVRDLRSDATRAP